MEEQKSVIQELSDEVIKSGEMKVDEIKEIQYILKLIHESEMTDEDKQSCGACLMCIIDLSNRFIKANADIDKLYKEKEKWDNRDVNNSGEHN